MNDSTMAELLADATDVADAIKLLEDRGFPADRARQLAGIHFGLCGGDRQDANGTPLPFLDLETELESRQRPQ